jgi:glycosyltransferase involved in cell wall biosynthesis
MTGMQKSLVVDDGSSDQTAEIARQSGVRLIQHPYNIGYGAALKTGYRYARGEIIVTIDGDGQHDPGDIARLLALIDRLRYGGRQPQPRFPDGVASRPGQCYLQSPGILCGPPED